ncbi:MAG: hypothetical protein LDL11_07165 [Desulfarculus sp.]|nr:hypothetical protein [Desulfarculus sp.]
MSFTPSLLIGVICLYMALLFVIALWVERRTRSGVNPGDSPLVYALSLAVYCTAWTYYGSVGKAATSGLLFLAVYLGPTLGALLCWPLLRRLVQIKQVHHLTSVADLISLRYGKSQGLGALVTFILVVGLLPYLALQIKATVAALKILVLHQSESFLHRELATDFPLVYAHAGAIITGLMVVFTIVFGIRRLDPTERHQGMIMAVAAESIVKLAAFLTVGVLVTYVLNDGFTGVLDQARRSPYLQELVLTGGLAGGRYWLWLTYLLLSMCAVLFLPRQFHVAVVENFDQRHIPTAMWLFPLYLFLINLFVLPIALAGLLGSYPFNDPDTFVLRLPLHHGYHWLSLLVFLGGFSAATAMVMVSTMTLSTMLTNHLLVPLLQRARILGLLRRHLLQCRWLLAALIIFGAYRFQFFMGWTWNLVDVGMVSFAAVAQLVPAILGGLYWPRSNKTGAILGLTAGFAVWAYTALLPVLAGSGHLASSLMEQGPWGMSYLRPEGLFGVSSFEPLTNTVFWSLLFNLAFYMLGSLLAHQGERERRVVEELLARPEDKAGRPARQGDEPLINLEEKLRGLEGLLLEYLPADRAQAMIRQCLLDMGLAEAREIPISKMAALYQQLENCLAGIIGAASASAALERVDLFSHEEARVLAEIYARMLTELRLSPQEMKRKIDFFREKEDLLRRESALLAHSQRVLDEKLESLDRLARSIAHEIRNPITAIGGLTQRLLRQGKTPGPETEYLNKILASVRSLERLVSEVRGYADLPPPALAEVDLGLFLKSLAEDYQTRAQAQGVALTLEGQAGQAGAVLAWVDRHLLDKALRVILDNALDVMPGGGELYLRLESDPLQAVIKITDTGPGIPPGDLPYMFDPLFSTKVDAVGMNLAIAKRIVNDHLGEIKAQNEPGRGASLVITLPLKPPLLDRPPGLSGLDSDQYLSK